MLRVAAAVLVGAAAFGAGAPTYRVVAYGPTWSPDGKHLAYVVHARGTGSTQTLEVGDAEGRNAQAVYFSTDACCSGPIQWASPSLIVLDDDYTVKTVSLATGLPAVRTLSRLGFSDFAVSGNGKLIAGFAFSGGHAPETIGISSVTGRGYHELAKPTKSTDDSEPDFSPDSRRLVFQRNSSLVVEPVAGGPVRTLAAQGALPQWSPDGRRIAFVDPGSRALMLVSSTGGTARLLVNGSFYATPLLFSWSPDSRRLAYADPDAKTLATIDVNGSRRTLPVGHLTPIDTPEWSPDGRRLAFTARSPTPTGQRVDVYVIGANGRGLRRVV